MIEIKTTTVRHMMYMNFVEWGNWKTEQEVA